MELNLQVKLLKTCGIFESRQLKWKTALISFQFFIMFSTSYTIFMMVTFVVRNYTDVLEIAECMAPLVTSIITLIKYGFLLLNSDVIFEMIKEIRILNSFCINSEHYKKIMKVNKLEKWVLKTMFGMCIGSSLGYVMLPIVKDIMNYFIFDDPLVYEMPFKTAFFYDISKSPAYELTYFFQFSCCFYAALLNVIVDTIFFGICMNICAHLQILRKAVHDIKLKEFVVYHQRIIETVTRLNSLFAVIIFTEYLILSLLLCVTGFQIVMSNDLIRIITCFFHGSAGLIDLLIYSYGGQKIMDDGLEICQEFYKIDKIYIFVLIRTKKELKIYSLMYHASLPTVSVIISRTMSLITMLQSFA